MNLDCWCGPLCYRPCDDCDPLEYRGAVRADLLHAPTHAGCWKCEHGLIPLTSADAAQSGEVLVIVHNA